MSLQESEETLSAITQLQKKMKTGQGIFEKANEDLKVLQRDIRDKQIALDTLRKSLQGQDNDALELLEKLWKQQKKIKGYLAAQSSDEIIQAIQEQNEFIDSELELITQQSEKIVSNLKLCQEFEQFLHEDRKDISYRSIEHKEEFAKFLEGNALLKEDDKQGLLEKNSQHMVELNASMKNLEERENSLIEQKKKLQNKDLADNLAVYVQPKLQELFKEWQAEIEKEIDVILADSPIIVEQYENVKLQEEEIRKIQDQIEQKTQIIEQNKQQEGQWFEELKQLEEKSYPPLSSAKQQQEDPVSHYPILQERANDAEVSVKHQIELGKLNTKLDIAEEEAAYKTYQLEQLKLSTDKERLSTNVQIQKNLALINELQERIGVLEREKKEQQIGQQQFIIPKDLSLFDELDKVLKPNEFVKLEARVNELTQENNDLTTKLAEVEKNAKKQLEVLSEEKESAYNDLGIAHEAQLEELKNQLLQTTEDLKKKQQELELEKLASGEKNKELEANLGKLTKVQGKLEDKMELLGKEKESATFNLQALQLAHEAILKGQSEAAAAELQEINKELSKLKLEQQKKQAELDRTKEELTGTSEKLLKAEELHGKESEQAKKLQDQVKKLTTVQHQLMTELKETKEEKESQIKALTEAKEVANLDLQAVEEKYAVMLKEQSEAAVAKLREVDEELSKLKSEQQEKQVELQKAKEELTGTSKKLFEAEELYGQESEQAKKLQAEVKELTTVQHQLTAELKETRKEKESQIKALTEAKEAANLDLQAVEEKYAVMFKEQSEAAVAKLREVDEELSKLKSEQQEKQVELQKAKEELTGTSKKLFEAEELYGQESEQAKKLQAEVKELTTVQHQLTAELKETRKEKESQIKALTEAKEAANLDLQAVEEKYAVMLKEQSEAAVAKLREVDEELSKLKSEQQEKQVELQKAKEELTGTSKKLFEAEELYGQESEQAKKLQAEVKELTTVQHQLTAELKETRKEKESQIKALTEAKEAANLDLQAVEEKYAVMLKEQSEAAVAKLREVDEELSKLKSEQQEKQVELQKAKEELTGTSKKLFEAEELYGQESEQAKKLQAEVKELTTVQHQLTAELKETRKEKESQIKALTEAKEAANLDLQAVEEKYAVMFKEQSEAAVAKLREVDEELSKLKSEQQEKQVELQKAKEELTGTSKKLFEAEELYGQESEQAKKLQAEVKELTTVQHQLTAELKETRKEKESQIKALTEAKEAANLDLQAVEEKYAVMLKEQSEAAVAKLREVDEELSKLKSEQQEKQVELQKAKEELTGTSKKLFEAEELYGQESEQAKKLQAEVKELTTVQHQLTTELKATKEEKESQIKALTEAKEAANLDLQAVEAKYAVMLKGQSEAAAAELQTINEKLSQLKLEQQESRSELEKKQQELIIVQESLKAAEQEYGVESKQAKELQAQLGGLTNENNSLKTQLEEIENAKEQLEILSGKKDLEYNYLEAEYEKQQAELKKIQQELTEVQEELTLVQYDQNKNFKTQLNKVTDENAGLKSQLEKIKEDTKNQLETLSARKDLQYNALEEKQKGDIDELWGRLEVAQEHAERIQKDEQARVTELKDKDVRIAELEAKNAALLEQLKKLQIKPEVQGAGIQTDEIASKSIGTGTENITKEFRAVDSQTDNRQKLYQSVGTEYRPRMDSGVSTEEVATNVTKVIVQEQTVPTSIEEQTVDKVLVQNKTKDNVYDDDKILQAFKELSREQVQPIVNKFSLESTSSFAQFAQENIGELSEAFRDSKVLREIENIEQRGYTDIHKKFAAEYKDIEWQEKESGKSFSLQQNGKDVVTINETTLNHDDKNAKYKTSEGEEIKNARMVNIPLSIDMKGACHMSFAVQDTNGRNISKEDAVYLTAHYKNGKLVHLTKPTEIFSCSDDNKSPLYLKRKGKTYTLPVDKSTLEQLEQEVLKNKGEYVGIVKNAQGNIRVNSAAIHGLQPDCVTADPLFKDASQLLHDANATPALDGSLDMKGLAHKKPNRNAGSVGKF